MGVSGQHHAPAVLPTGKRPGTYCIGGCVGPRACLNGAENLTPSRDSIPDRPVRIEALYRLSYPSPPDSI
jgi:hypothetical protein